MKVFTNARIEEISITAIVLNTPLSVTANSCLVKHSINCTESPVTLRVTATHCLVKNGYFLKKLKWTETLPKDPGSMVYNYNLLSLRAES